MTLMNWPEMASTGEAILFGCVAVFMIACALGVLFFKKAVHCAICMVGVMLGLAVLYLMHGAAFLGTVQVVVYTGAIMVLFLFVIMMIGLGASDNYAQQSRGRIITSVLIALGLAAVVIGAVARSRATGCGNLAHHRGHRRHAAHSLRSARPGPHPACNRRGEDARL